MDTFHDHDAFWVKRCQDCDCALGNENDNDDCDCERCLAHWMKRREIEHEVAANLQWAENIGRLFGLDGEAP